MRDQLSLAVLGVSAGLVLLFAAAPGARQEPAPQTTPVFRADVDVVQLDVLVLDNDRRPIRGLTSGDFTILESGEPQTPVAFSEIAIAPTVRPPATWMRDVASDVVSNDTTTRRLVIIVLDDGYTGMDQGEPRIARLTARQVVEELGPDDLAAVIFTYMGRMQNFTADRAQLLAAIDSFKPQNGIGGVPLGCRLRLGGCAASALRRVAETVRDAPPGRKLVVFISPGLPGFDPDHPTFPTRFRRPGGLLGDDFGAMDGLTPHMLREIFEEVQLSNIAVYEVDPKGLESSIRLGVGTDISASTGGRRIRGANNPWELIPGIFEENSTYYLIGYQSTAPEDKSSFRRIEVRVNRPGAKVQTRSGYYPPHHGGKSEATGVEWAIGKGVMRADVPIRVATAAFAVPGERDADLIVLIGLEDRRENPIADADGSREVELLTMAFDAGWRARAAHRQTVDLAMPPVSGPRHELATPVRLRPGRYEIRVAAERAGRAGSAFVSVDIPDFSSEDLSASTLVLTRESGAASAGPWSERLIGILPTIDRVFFTDEQITARLWIYQMGRKTVAPVTVDTKIVGMSRPLLKLGGGSSEILRDVLH